jgi:precorrin-2 dehydrogenase/sirohydrochlorin ferrochelatase
MGAIVTKGNLKIGISTNGKSPTLAKRIRQFLEELLPEEVNDLLDTLQNYRNTLNGDFEFKVNEMNKVTKSILEK